MGGKPQVATRTTQFEGRLSAPINVNVENAHDAWKSKYASSIHAGIQMKGCNSRDGLCPPKQIIKKMIENKITKKKTKKRKKKPTELTNTNILNWWRGFEDSLMRFIEGMTSTS